MLITTLGSLLHFFDVRGLLLLFIIFVPLERLLALRRQPMFRKWWWNDLTYVFFNRIFLTVGVAALIALVSSLAGRLVPAKFQAAVAGQPYWLQVVEIIILADLGFYSAHRMFHAVPWLWKFHSVHHSIEHMDWLAAVRVHPLDQVVTRAGSVLPLVALGFSAAPLAMFWAIYFWHSFLLHSNMRLNFGPLRRLIASPEFHHWHHANEPAAWNSNYGGQLCILDKLFSTLYMPDGQIPAKYGIEDPVPACYLPQLIYPFQRSRHPSAEAPDVGARRALEEIH